MALDIESTALSALTVAGVPTMGMSGVPVTRGNVYFVNSTYGAAGNPGSAGSPIDTLANALAKCTANNGDVIVLTAGHAETVSAAAGINVNVAGVTIVAAGDGDSRPTFTFGTSTAATITITAASVTFGLPGNPILGVCNIDQIVSPIVVSGAACSVAIEWRDGAANQEALRAILTSATADNFNAYVKYNGFTAGTHCVNAVRLVGCNNGNITIDFYGKASTAIVEFATTACSNINVSGYFYNSGTTDFTKNVVDTVTGSTWYSSGFDGAAGAAFGGGSGAVIAAQANLTVPAANAVTNLLERDVIGNKTDTNVYGPTATGSLAGYMKGAVDLQESVTNSGAAVMSNNLVVFNIAGGPIEIMELISICQTANGLTASTLQWTSDGTLGATTATITGASGALTSATAGTNIAAQLGALATAPVINANGVNISSTPGTIIVPAGDLKLTIGVGSTTGTWKHYIRYKPLAYGVTVAAAF